MPLSSAGVTSRSRFNRDDSRSLPTILQRPIALLTHVPRAGRACFFVALVNAIVWSVLVPPFQVPDEISHFGYAQYLAETGKPPPQGPGAQYSPQEQRTLEALDFFVVVGHPGQRGILTSEEDESLRDVLATHPSPRGEGGATSITNQPPLYYALETIPYWLSPSHEILARLALMRLLSALMAACTVLCVFLFLREMLPGSPWAWTVGSLVVAFQPTFDFISAGVQGDNLLFLASAATFFALARAYRRGLTGRRAAAIGIFTVAGVLGKLTFIALVPGIALAVLLLGWRAWPHRRARAVRDLGITAAIVVLPVLVYALLDALAWHRSGGATAGGFGGAATAALPSGHTVSFKETLDYIWQLYLPRLPFMHREFAYFPPTTVWLNGWIGRFGWLDYSFPNSVYSFSRWLFVGLALLAAGTLVQLRAKIRPLLPLLGCFAVMMVGLCAAIGYAGIRYRAVNGFPFEQARYLLPLLGLYALFAVLAARGLGRRWAPALGGALVVLAMFHGLMAETLTISRYYG
jgi:4-amino-4-deoxy-L-arabinose transferase-like glycosyltransferase